MIHEAGTLVGMDTHVIAVVGATATGKSGLAIALARALGGEVVNADSMQLYQGMDIGTAKEPEAARQGVPHHLLGIWPVTRTANVADYQELARAAIDDIIARHHVPLLVGGSGLYVRAALDDLDFHGTDRGIRTRLESELAEVGPAALHARLATLDPNAAAAILPSNGRRIVRALEVIELTGGPFAATMPVYEQVRPAVQLGLTLPRPELDQRIADRVRGHVAGRLRSRGEGTRPRRAAGRQDRQPGPRLPADAPTPGRRAHPRRSAPGDGQSHPAVRPPPGILVPSRPPRPLARRQPSGRASPRGGAPLRRAPLTNAVKPGFHGVLGGC